MVFSSTVFLLLFLPLTLIGYYNPFWKSRNFKNGFLLLASLLFYGWGEPLFVFIMIASIAVNWFLVILMDRREGKGRKTFMLAAVVYDIGLLFVFKYVSWISRNIGLLLKNDGLTVNIALPIGISFFTFQIMSYVLDVYYRKAPVQRSLINTALYISLFPQLIAGPIVRYETVAREINDRKESLGEFMEGEARFLTGLCKKILIANYMGFITDRIFALNGELSVASAWLGGVAYTIQIYFDFSGYSDMAIGLGRMFGFHFHENFNYPFIAATITDYWKRWHISLSSWFRDYLFYPLVLRNRESKGWILWSLFMVWLLTGIWHGANWTCVSYGVFYFVLLAFERFTGAERKLKKSRVFSRLYVLFFVVINFVIFRSENIVLAGQYLGAMFGIGAAGLVDDAFFLYLSNCKWILLAGMVFSTPVVPFCKKKLAARNPRLYRILYAFGSMALFTVVLLVCIKSTYNPFIYFNF
jgi:D-alanyl-lipoteichoic acid acyltransferase DltB (MBOAT superfamily)